MSYGINGQSYQHSLIDVQANGGTGSPYQFTRFKSIDYKDAAKKEAVKDARGQNVAYVIGEQETEGSMSMLLEEWFVFRDWLRLQAQAIAAQIQRPVGIGQVAFDMTVQYGQTVATIKRDRLNGVMVQEEPRKSSDDQKVLVVEIPLFILSISDEQGRTFISY
jgi:hypothetical protein